VAAQNIFHPVFELELAFLESDFFDLLRFAEVRLARKLVEAIVEFVVLGCELTELLVSLE
jgi:hypothetical protein